MSKKYEVQTKFVYGWENVWHDENDKLIYYKNKKSAMNDLKSNVDDWNNHSNTTEKYSYDNYRVVYTDKNNNTYVVFKTFD